MTKRLASLISGLLLACGLAAFTGSALAGSGHGNGQDKSTSASAGQATVDQNAGAQSGVKPDSNTAKGNKPTTCSTGGGTGSSATCTSSGSNAATAQTAGKSDQSKKYGRRQLAKHEWFHELGLDGFDEPRLEQLLGLRVDHVVTQLDRDGRNGPLERLWALGLLGAAYHCRGRCPRRDCLGRQL